MKMPRGRPWTVSFAEACPNLISEWNLKKNTVSPDSIAANSHAKVWWICDKNHEYLMSPASRKQLLSCPFCSGARVCVENSLATICPEVAKSWCYEKNVLTPNDVTYGSKKKVWWQCSKEVSHQWEAPIVNRVNNGTGCPYCSNNKVSASRSLMNAPYIDQWHPSKNNDLKAAEISIQSNKKIWWLCAADISHEWVATPADRTGDGTGCPYCSGNKVCVSNCIETLRPDLLDEWDFERNTIIPKELTCGSNIKIWWKCQNSGHSWLTTPHSRTSMKSGCPECYLAPRSVPEILIAAELKLFLNVDLNKHKLNIKDKTYDVDIIIDSLNVVIEYDGKYWHKDKIQSDFNKTSNITNAGYYVLRIRQAPLQKINEQDIIATDTSNEGLKKIVNQILILLNNTYKLGISLDNYIKIDKLCNEKIGMDYIKQLRSTK